MFPDKMGTLSQKPPETELVLWTRAKEQLSLYKGRGSTSGDEEELSAFIPTSPNDHHQKALRRRRWEEFMEMTPWS